MGAANAKAAASIVVNHLGLVDQLQIAASGLTPNAAYQLVLDQSIAGKSARTPLAKLKVGGAGTAIAQSIGPIRNVGTGSDAKSPGTWHLLVVDGNGKPVLQQAAGDR